MSADLSLGHTAKIIAAATQHGLTARQTAYVLATALWETNRTMMPVVEAYWLSEAWRAKNLRYYPWHGRGFVQLTWESNYRRAGTALGVDLIAAPDRALDPDIAAQILVVGCKEGWFTGKRLTDYINPSATDYIGARRIINGTDQASTIAALALSYEAALTPAPDYPCVRRGSIGAAVVALQRALAAHGYAVGAADGVFGGQTEIAARQFQADNALTSDGIAGPKTWAALLA